MHGITRRDWMLAAACWTHVLRGQTSSPRFAYFDPATAGEIEAIADTIIPGDETPGAREAGVIWFIDGALAGYDKDQREIYRKGLADTERKRADLFPGSQSIAGLTSEQRITLLKAVEDTGFFVAVRRHTILGFFGHPKYGGNRHSAASRLLGIETATHFQPPFGYYDQELEK
ncbi:MAG: gluconate 2-dehydrogenase subunit 3 family protein [Acidobacteriaceae bacterium]|nr:gluconate 2-dehydrogenase subunit 3 family protein [Acidobacteriaceae bacterium]